MLQAMRSHYRFLRQTYLFPPPPDQVATENT